MPNKTIEQRVKAVIAAHLGLKEETFTLNASLIDELGADSLDTVEIVMALEEEFEFEIDDESAMKIETVQQAIDAVRARIPASAA